MSRLAAADKQKNGYIIARTGIAGVLAFCLAFFGLVPLANAAVVELRHGQLDVFNVTASGGQLQLNVREHITGTDVARDPENVVLAVGGTAYTSYLKSMPQIAQPAYMLSQNGGFNLLQPGFNTTGVAPRFEDIEFEIVKLQGPGRVFAFDSGRWGVALSALTKEGKLELFTGSVLEQDYPRQRNISWAFTTPGQYRMEVVASGVDKKTGKRVKSAVRRYTWQVRSANPLVDPERSEDIHVNRVARAATPAPAEQCFPVQGESTPARSVQRVWGSAVVSPNTHVHPNWAFSAPGQYRVGLRIDVQLKDGGKASANTTLNFNVGGSGNANDGHFDLGARLEGERLVASVKDDRVSPSKWVDPTSLTFGLGDAARAQAVAGMEFVAQAGQPIWLIGSSQVSGVPWLGANSMHESIINGTTGTVTFTPTSVSGPGNFAVFTSGSFGKAVGQKWFGATLTSEGGAGVSSASGSAGKTADGRDCVIGGAQSANAPVAAQDAAQNAAAPATEAAPQNAAAPSLGAAQTAGAGAGVGGGAGGASSQICRPVAGGLWGSATIAPNTHVHPNWVFSAPGRYAVRVQMSARLKSGQVVRGVTTLNFNVGGAGSANSGHYDLGAQIVGGKLVPALKNDNTQPASWVDPSSVVFGLGKDAATKAPAGIEFVAGAGAPIWMIGSTQVRTVPWLGANTMHPSMRETDGKLTLTPVAVSGPGRVAVFTSGNFGQIVGAKWFGGGGAAGKTPDGRDCVPGVGAGAGAGGMLAATGSPLALALAVFGGGILVLGFGVRLLHQTNLRLAAGRKRD